MCICMCSMCVYFYIHSILIVNVLLLLVCGRLIAECLLFTTAHSTSHLHTHTSYTHYTHNYMKQFSASTKHSILLEYTPHSPTHSFSELAARHGVAGGRSTIQTWHSRWDDTIASLQHKKGAGRPRRN